MGSGLLREESLHLARKIFPGIQIAKISLPIDQPQSRKAGEAEARRKFGTRT